MIRKEEDGKVRLTKTEKPTQHGAWTGAGVGALVGILFRPAVSAPRSSRRRRRVDNISQREIFRGDLKELGDELQAGTAAVIAIAESKIEEQLEKATKRANKVIEKEVDADADELAREIDAAAKESTEESPLFGRLCVWWIVLVAKVAHVLELGVRGGSLLLVRPHEPDRTEASISAGRV